VLSPTYNELAIGLIKMKPNMSKKELQDLIQKNMEEFWEQAASTKHLVIRSNPEYTHTISNIPDALFNSLLSAEFSDHNVDKKIAEIKSYYNQKGLSFCWWISESSTPASLEKNLRNINFNYLAKSKGWLSI
jgi:hypothetical protein